MVRLIVPYRRGFLVGGQSGIRGELVVRNISVMVVVVVVVVVQMLTVADDSTLRERERNGLCQRSVNNSYKPITTRITETSELRPATSLLRKAVMHEDDKNMFSATQSKGKTEASRVFFLFFFGYPL